MWLRFLRDLYSLETLDARFAVPSTSPPREPLADTDNDDSRLAEQPAPFGSLRDGDRFNQSPYAADETAKSGSKVDNAPLWSTTEFYFYYVIAGGAVLWMCLAALTVSAPTDWRYGRFKPWLSKGWIPGRLVDNSDQQYASFRNNVPYLFIVVILHPLLRRGYDYITRANTYTKVRPSPGGSSLLSHGLPGHSAADARLEQRVYFDVGFAIIFTFVLHGIGAFKVFFILYLNYKLATRLPRQYVPVAAWVFNVGILFANELTRGYELKVFEDWMFRSPIGEPLHLDRATRQWARWLDGFGGLIPRWEVLFNITVLRLISFDLDYYWSTQQQGSNSIELDASNLSERNRVSIPARPGDYCFRNYIGYALYSPLYLAGPIITFNDFISQLRYKLPSINRRRSTLYAIRFLITLLTMEIMIHYIYVVALSKADPLWPTYTPFQLGTLGYFSLHHIWLKLLLPFRFFRMWSLFDGIDPPENMVRCVSDNYSALAFWRGWHRSFNRWVIRYIYVPMGGSGGRGYLGQARSIANFLTVFTFVALWHDIKLRLLMWGWLITLFVLPETIAILLFPKKQWADRPTVFRWICGVGAVGNILMMMTANLVGFALGLDGIMGLYRGIVGKSSGLAFMTCACVALFTGAQVMFEVREQEMRRGIKIKC